MNIRKLTLIALLAALGTVGRYAFSYIPNVQPVTALIIICGIWLGPVAGVTLAVLSTILSNMLLGMGIWTLSQIIAWAIIGLLSGLLGKYNGKLPVWFIGIFSGIAGYFYGFVISLAYGTIGDHFWLYYLRGIPFDTNHAIGNVAFIIILYPVLSRLFQRYGKDINQSTTSLMYNNSNLHNHHKERGVS